MNFSTMLVRGGREEREKGEVVAHNSRKRERRGINPMV